MKIFFKSKLDLDGLAIEIRKVLNIPQNNRSKIVQSRDGLNIGDGRYYYFEVLGLKLYLIRNACAVFYGKKKDFQFYLYAQNHNGLNEDLDPIMCYLAQVFKEEGFEVELGETEE
jgi:hypothetical protein